MLKTACSGAPRTKEYERALSLLGKGQHPKSSAPARLPSPITDEEWDQRHQDHGNLFLCLRELSSSRAYHVSTPRARTASRVKEDDTDNKHTQTNAQTNTQTNTHTHTHTNKQTPTHTDTHTLLLISFLPARICTRSTKTNRPPSPLTPSSLPPTSAFSGVSHFRFSA